MSIVPDRNIMQALYRRPGTRGTYHGIASDFEPFREKRPVLGDDQVMISGLQYDR